MREVALRFGRETPLAGVVTEPEAGSDAASRPTFLFVNAGILHRVGTCRLHVRLARLLAAQGHRSLRFDFSGVGDSDVRRDALPFEESSVAELREAMDHLEDTTGSREFAVLGLCTGASVGLEAAVADPRIRALALIDGLAYRTARYYAERFGPRLLDASAWWNAARVRLADARRRLAGAAEGPGSLRDLPPEFHGEPTRAEAEANLRDITGRGVELLCIFTGDSAHCYNYRGQYRAAFPRVDFGRLLREEYLPESDHIFTREDAQAQLLDWVGGWARELWPSAAGAGRA